MRPSLLLALLPLLATPAFAADPPASIQIWTRSDTNQRVAKVALDDAQAKTVERKDAQYDATHKFRQLAIADLLKKYQPPADTDLALLHFANGMAIPLPFRDAATMERLQPAIAIAIEREGAMTRSFPVVAKKESNFVDARPIRFSSNKVVVGERWHPQLSAKALEKFSPWLFADTLTGIELVKEADYFNQFDIDPATKAGFSVFRQVCSFCHGVRKTGASFGWDVVDPLPLVEYRKKESSLYYHIRYRSPAAVQKGLMMPALDFVTEQEAGALLAWMRSAAEQPLRPYRSAGGK